MLPLPTKSHRSRRNILPALLSFALGLAPLFAAPLTLRENPTTHTFTIHRASSSTPSSSSASAPILTQTAAPDLRPYLHPLIAPDGQGELTEFSPGHHKHQHGIYWGFTKLNGRDYFHNPGATHWRRVSARIVTPTGDAISWETVYENLSESGQPILRETQRWTMRDFGDRYHLDLEWTGKALADVTVAEADYGGLFVRMPWAAGRNGAVQNNNRQRNERANAQRDVWIDIGLQVPGRTDFAHIALLDHPQNPGHPLPWRVDRQLGVGHSRAGLGDLKLTRNQEVTYRHRLLVYTGQFNDVAVNDAWTAYTGRPHDSANWNLARAEAKKAQFLTGEQAIAKMTVPDGFEVKLFASEPQITQPMAFCWDDRGRLWVAENRDYETRKTGFSKFGDSRILILEDTDGDGKMDTKKVFLEGIPFPAALAWGMGGLWLGAPPNLLFVPDRNGDDKADIDKIEIRLTGWGIQDRHETLNSLIWGPDGWLYGCQGFATRSNVGKPADGGRLYKAGEPFPEKIAVKDPQYIDGGVWRYHPTKDRFEVVAHGFSNPWGLDFDDHGQAFISACVIPHLWHVIPGGIYHRQGGKHINPHVYSDIKTIADHRHRSAHGGARIYLADEFPKEYRGRILMANIHEHALLADILEPKGSGFVGRHGDDPLLANDPQWVGFSVEIGPDGAVYILDWHDADICGMDTHNKDTGRIFRLAPKGLAAKTNLNLAAKTDAELVDLQQHRNDWYVRRARVLLQERAVARKLDPSVSTKLFQQFESASTAAKKLRALWALHVTNNLPTDRLLAVLDHPDAHLRAWAIQLLCEDNAPPAAALPKFATLAARDPSPVVRLHLASALQRLPLAQRWPIAEALVQHASDATDHNLPHMLWFGIEPLVPADTTKALDLASRSAIPLVAQYVVRRAVAAKQLDAVAAALVNPAFTAARAPFLTGLRDGLSALTRHEITAPSNWPEVAAKLTASASSVADAATRDLITQIGQLFGDAKAAATQLATLQDKNAPADRRREIVAAFARDAYAPALAPTLALLDDPALRRDALRALAAYDDPKVANELLRRFTSFNDADRAEAVLTLAARKSSADRLLAALKQNKVARRDVSAFAARQLQRVVGPAFVDFWGSIAQPAAAKQAEIAKYKTLLTDDVLAKANPRAGRAVFERTCSACHQLYGAGGKIGPDITGSNRANLDYLLGEIVTPSDVIQDGYHLVTITTRDGRTLAGNIAAEDDRTVTLRLIGQETRVAKADILNREVSPVSMMPEGLLQNLTEPEIRDLVAYLRTTQQVPLPAP